MKTGMDGPQEGNSMHGRKEGRAVLPLSNSQRALAIPDRPTKMESDCPHSATHKRCPHGQVPAYVKRFFMDKGGNFILC